MKVKITIYIAMLVTLAAIGTGAIVYKQPSDLSPATDKSTATKVTNRSRTEIAYIAKAGMTALEQLKSEADNVVVKDSQYGSYIDSIEGHVGGTDGKYWSFYIDGEMSNVGAADYKQQGREAIVWKFQKL